MVPSNYRAMFGKDGPVATVDFLCSSEKSKDDVFREFGIGGERPQPHSTFEFLYAVDAECVGPNIWRVKDS